MSVWSHTVRLRDPGWWRVYAGMLRYPDGRALSAQGRARREKLRLQAAQMFEQDIDPVQVARRLRVSTKSPAGAACRRPFTQGRNPPTRVYESIGPDFFLALAPS